MNRSSIEGGTEELLDLFDMVSEEAKIEKLGDAKPPINQILYWWTRKPLVVGRAVALSSTLIDIKTVKELLRIEKVRRAFRNEPNLKRYEEKLGTLPSSIKVLDPFAGAGNLLFEAKKLGLDTTTLDLNPVAYLIQKCVLEYPAKYGTRLADDVEKYAIELSDRTRRDLSSLYNKNGATALTYLWTWCIRCPYCEQRMPLMNHMWFARTKKRKIGFRIKLTADRDFRIELIDGITEKEAEKYTQKGGKAICLKCRNSIGYDHLTSDISTKKDKELIAIVIKGSKGKDYQLASEEDKKHFHKAQKLLKKSWDQLSQLDLIPTEEIRPGHRREHLLWHYGIRYWHQFYNERQLLVLTRLLQNLKSICSEITDKEYAKVIATYLAFILCKHADRNCIGIMLIPNYGRIAHALGFRSARLIYNFAETNPFGDGGGSLVGMTQDVTDAIRFAANNKNLSKVTLGSVLHLPFGDETFDLIITDPPYSDDVQYGEMSDFMYVWLHRALRDHYPELPETVPLDEDISVSWGRFGDKKMAEVYYEKAMKVAFQQISRVLKDDGLLVVFFAHSSTEAWNMLLQVLREAKLMVSSSYAMHTESTENPLARGKTSFMSSIVVACRKIPKENEAYFEDLIPEMEDKVKALIKSIDQDKLISMPITDLIIMVYGEVLEVATRHTKIKSFNAEFKPDFENLISQARESILREILAKILGKSPNLLGPEVSFYLLARVFYRGYMNANDALKMTRAYGLQGTDLENSDIVEIEEGNIRLLSFNEMDLDLKPDEVKSGNLHQQLMYLEKVAAEDGANKVKKLINYNNFRVNDLTQIIALLIKSYRVVQNKGKKLDEDETKEFKVLQAIADVLGVQGSGAGVGGNMDRFL